ncbi:MAG: exodeoxyribonuclease VII large subunit, partial [Candidatus Eremiobacterota bacterium]
MIHTVSSLMQELSEALQAQPGLQSLTVRGEISDLRRSSARHLYFVLKDDQCELRCVMFAKTASFLRFPPSNGLQVLAQGGVELYGTRGDLRLLVRGLRPDGPGALRLKLEQLRARLKEEGLFDRPKRPLPALPRLVGVVTSREGAVLRDIHTTLRRRNPAVGLVLCPAPVQGPEAPPRLIYALERLVAYGVDCIVVARGGGSLEDLMAFNDEDVVRAVAACPVPVVSAIGHETDVTLCDLAADRRAPTPTAAAEMVAQDRGDMLNLLEASRGRLQRAMARQLAGHRERLDRLRGSPAMRYPRRPVELARERLESLSQ